MVVEEGAVLVGATDPVAVLSIDNEETAELAIAGKSTPYSFVLILSANV